MVLVELHDLVTLDFPRPKRTLAMHGLRPKRGFGQNFLCDEQLVEKIAACCGDVPATVVEIGAGLGGLTVCLLRAGHQVTAIERDRDLVPILRDLTSYSDANLRVLEADAKTLDLMACFQGAPKPHVLTGNLPYNLTGPLMRKAIGLAEKLQRVVFLLQLEVADRLAAKPNSPAYGALSVFTQAAFEVKREFVVRRGAFYPQPGVDSALVSLLPRSNPVPETREFRLLVNAAFAKRRKTLRNAWKGLVSQQGDDTGLQHAADIAGISLDARGETLGVDDFLRMSEQLGS